jgi:23S rRNA (uracil1939-C5)-methyltransferase
VPGDIVDVQVTGSKKNYKEGYPVNFHVYSDKRIEPFCEHFGLCGGCTRQLLSYHDQLFYKQKQVEETLKRISKIPLPAIGQILPAPDTIYYRNKLEYTFTESRWLTHEEIQEQREINDFKGLGFHIPGRYDKILDIRKCMLQADPSNDIRLFVKDFAIRNDYPFFNLYKVSGFLRTLIIRTAISGEIMIILSFFKEEKDKIHRILDAISERFPNITSINYAINGKSNDSIQDIEIIHYKGKDHIMEQMGDCLFQVSPKSFYQTNSKQAYNLYAIVKEYANLTKSEVVYDLYTGTGTIANFIARDAKAVIGVEYVEEAIKDANINSEINGIKNTRFYSGDIKDVLNQSFIEEQGKPDVVILDPPRAGVHEKVVERIIESMPDRIVYVSCNVATQARDLELFYKSYDVVKIQPVDMFPHTHHIENVVLMKLRK